MSRHGSPSESYPGEPYLGGPDPRYDPPSDPWGGIGHGSGHWGDPTTLRPNYDRPYPGAGGHAEPDYDYPGAGYDRPDWIDPPSPRRPRRSALVVLLVMVILLVAGGVATVLYLASGGGVAVAVQTPEPPGAVGETSSVEGLTSDNIGLAAGLARVGDCLVNDGTDAVLQMRITRCDDEDGQVYRVLARFDEAASNDDEASDYCAGIEGYRFHYYFITEAEGQSFVLCMTEA